MQNAPEAKKPCKGILKTSSSFDKPSVSYRKSAKFDEINVLETFHPADKDYGHMKIDEPKTPYNYSDINRKQNDELDAELLAEKLRIAANTRATIYEQKDFSDEEETIETEFEKAHRLEFERRRKSHYNEYEAVKLARKLIEEELLDDDKDEPATSTSNESNAETKTANSNSLSTDKTESDVLQTAPTEKPMDVDQSSELNDKQVTKTSKKA